MDYDPGLAGNGFYSFAMREGAGLLWRFGWDATVDGLRFEVRDRAGGAGNLRTVTRSAYPLYRGTWYHLAVTVTGGQLTILVDGQVVASQTDTNFLPRTGTQALRIGFDTVTNTYLKGTVDEVAVYSTRLQTSAVAAIRTFVAGSNAIIVPRGLFYESLLNQTLGGPDARAANPALLKVTVHANQFATDGPMTLDAYLNGRPIQQVISGNLTLAEAQWFADQLTANRSLARSAFLLPVHREFWTMGFDATVISLTPNAVVANSGNFSAPAAPKEWWELIWNAVESPRRRPTDGNLIYSPPAPRTGRTMKSIDELANKALDFKKKGLTEKEIGDELHLSPETVTWLLTRGVTSGDIPKDVKIGWKSVGVYGARMGFLAAAMTDIIAEESEKAKAEPDTILGIAINGIPYATLVSEDLSKELAIYRPTGERHGGGGAFSSNYANVDAKRVVLIDDVMSTGDTLAEAIQEIQKLGGKPMLCVVLVNKTGKNDVLGVPVRGLIRARILS